MDDRLSHAKRNWQIHNRGSILLMKGEHVLNQILEKAFHVAAQKHERRATERARLAPIILPCCEVAVRRWTRGNERYNFGQALI